MKLTRIFQDKFAVCQACRQTCTHYTNLKQLNNDETINFWDYLSTSDIYCSL
jgi:hypothetical protein